MSWLFHGHSSTISNEHQKDLTHDLFQHMVFEDKSHTLLLSVLVFERLSLLSTLSVQVISFLLENKLLR